MDPATIAAIISAVTTLAGTGASMYNQRRTLQDQEDQALAGMANQRAKQREIDARIDTEIGSLEQSNPDDERAASLEAYLSQLRANRSGVQGETTPGVSRYGEDTALAQAGVQNYGQKVAGILSRLDATREQRRNEGFGINRMASDVTGTQREASGDDFINRLRMSQIQPNVWLDAGSELARGVGSGMAAYAGSQPSNYETLAGQVARTGAERVGPRVWGGGTVNSTQSRMPVPGRRMG